MVVEAPLLNCTKWQSTLSQEHCEQNVLYWKLMSRQFWTLACPILDNVTRWFAYIVNTYLVGLANVRNWAKWLLFLYALFLTIYTAMYMKPMWFFLNLFICNAFHTWNTRVHHHLITKTEYFPYFIVKFIIKCLPASWLSIASPDTDVMFQLRLPYTSFFFRLALLCLVESVSIEK